MTTYTLHLPRDARPGDPTALDESELVKDAFSWGAFFFTFLWFFYHRLWLAGIGVLILVFAFGGLMAVLDVHPLAGSIAQALLQALIGLEAKPSALPRNPAPSAVLSTPRRPEPVIGLFPDAERPR
jgi:hypothetical protein